MSLVKASLLHGVSPTKWTNFYWLSPWEPGKQSGTRVPNMAYIHVRLGIAIPQCMGGNIRKQTCTAYIGMHTCGKCMEGKALAIERQQATSNSIPQHESLAQTNRLPQVQITCTTRWNSKPIEQVINHSKIQLVLWNWHVSCPKNKEQWAKCVGGLLGISFVQKNRVKGGTIDEIHKDKVNP